VLPDDGPGGEPETGYAEAPRRPGRPARGRGRRPEAPRSTASPRLRAAVAAELERGEKILWCGQPCHERALVWALAAFIPGGALVLAGLVWLLVGLLRSDAHRSGALDVCWPLVLLAAGAGCGALGVHWLWPPFHTCYAVTDRRALVWRRGWLGGTALEEYTAEDVGALTCREGPGGAGDLIFRTKSVTYSWAQGKEVRTAVRTSEYGFKGVRRVRAVEKLVRETLGVRSP
jgi:hypothetical protein